MKWWSFQYAKARVNKFLAACLHEAPQVVKCVAKLVVLVPMAAWRRLQPHSRPTLKELLLADKPRLEIPVRRYDRKRRTSPDMG